MNLDGIKNGGLSVQCLMVDIDIIMKARLQFLKTESVPQTHNHFSVRRITGTISVSDDFVFSR